MAMRADDLMRVSREEYLAGEAVAATKSEWVDGAVYAMAGASKLHVRTVTRIVRLLADHAERDDCLLGSSDLLVETANACYYPDVVLSCESSDDARIETRPCFIAEVLSPSTKRGDRHEKRDAYLAMPSMREYWIVDAEAKIVEVWTLTAEGWQGDHRTAGQELRVECLDLALRVVDIVGV